MNSKKKLDKYKGKVFESKLLPYEIDDLFDDYNITHFKQLNEVSMGSTFFFKSIPMALFNGAIQYLDLSDNSLGNEGAKTIAAALKSCTSLTYLDLSNNGISSDMQTLLVISVLQFNTPLATLSLFDRVFPPQDCSPYAQLITHCATLTSLALSTSLASNIQLLFQALKFNTTLRELRVTGRDRPLLNRAVDECFETNKFVLRGFGPNGTTRWITVNQLCNELRASDSERRSIPKQLIHQHQIEIFLKELIGGGGPMNLMKLLVLGNGEVGKTTLLNTLQIVQKELLGFIHKASSFLYSTSEIEPSKLQRKYRTAKDRICESRTVGIDQSKLKLRDGELSIWDFAGQAEYAVTHSFFLSDQLSLYLICYDLSQPNEVQMQQLAYWLDYLQSVLPLSTSASSLPNWRIFVVGTKLDQCVSVRSEQEQNALVASWQARWSGLPIHSTHFAVSSSEFVGVEKLLVAIQDVCSSIFQHHTVLIPSSYLALLKFMKSIPEDQSIFPLSDLAQMSPVKFMPDRFDLATKYLHSTGQSVLLKSDMICTAPQMIPKLYAKFISPADIRMKLAERGRVEILEENQIGTILMIHDNKHKVQNEVRVLERIGVCFRLSGENAYLFPSLAPKRNAIKFSIEDRPNLRLAATRFSAPLGRVFVMGFYCQLVVALLEKLNISKREIISQYGNCVALTCSGIFVGELLVAIEDGAKSIIAMMKATNPDLSIVVDTFYRVTRDIPQYAASKQEVLCPTCVDLSYFQSQFPHEEIGTIEIDDNRSSENDAKARQEEDTPMSAVFCKPRVHEVENYKKPQPPRFSKNKQPRFCFGKVILDITICWSHNRSTHHFFLNYRVATEGRRSSSASSEADQGLVEILYNKLATAKQKDGQAVFVFWDKKCLNYGQNWENGFMHGLNTSKVVLLLISHKAIEGIAKNAAKQQDNVLIEYEYAILQNELNGTPVLRIFAAEMTDDGQFIRFEYEKALELLPDAPHKRKANSQSLIDDLSESLSYKKKDFLKSIKVTVEKIISMQGMRLTKRGEDDKELQTLVDKAMDTLNWVAVATPSASSPSSSQK